MARPRKHCAFDGAQIAALRRQGVPWKLIEFRFGEGRRQLLRALRRYEAECRAAPAVDAKAADIEDLRAAAPAMYAGVAGVTYGGFVPK